MLDKPEFHEYCLLQHSKNPRTTNRIWSAVPREFRTDIQALRGIAVLLVVLYHANLGIFPAGYLGVDIFFVISGFLITNLIKVQIQQKRFSFWEFYYRRAKRLLPAFYVVIALTTVLAPFFLSDLSLQEFRYQVLGALTFTGNIALWLQSDYFAQAAESKPLLHVWSLAVEEQYYLLLPAFLVLVPRRLWLIGLGSLLILSFTLCFFLAPRDPAAAFYLLPTRFWEMAIGSVGALVPKHYVHSQLSWLRLPAVAILIITPIAPVGGPHPGIDAAVVCLAALILLLAPTKDNIVVRILSKVGDFSYSLYLIHWPVLVYVRAAWFPAPPEAVIYGALAFSFAASWGLYRFIEEPFRKGFSSARIQLTSGLIGASLILGIAPSVIIAATASDIDFNKIRRVNLGLGRECSFRPGAPPGEIPKECQTVEKPRMLVWGDSYAMALVPGLARTIGEEGLAQLTMSSCPPTIGMAIFSDEANTRYPQSFAESCMRFNDSVLSILKAHPDIETVTITSQFSALASPKLKMLVRRGTKTFVEETSIELAVMGMKALIEKVRALGKRILIVGPPPSSGVDIGECLERRAKGRLIIGSYSNCEIPVSEHLKYQSDVIRMLNQVQSEARVDLLSLADLLCDKNTCKTQIQGKFLYRDYGHLSYEGSESVALELGLAQKLLRSAR